MTEEWFPPDGRPRFVPAWATVALDAAELHGDQVDRDLGVWSSPTGAWEPGTYVDLVEAGKLTPGFCVVLRLSTMTGMAPMFFYQPIRIGTMGPAFMCDRSRWKHGLTIGMSYVDGDGVLHSRFVQPSRETKP